MRILLVDDEPLLLKAYGRFLRRKQECVVVTAEGGAQALQQLENDEPFDLVFCDLAMPDLTGIEVHRATCEFHPELRGRFVFLTGGAQDAESEAYVRECGARVLVKPVPLAEFEKILAGPI